MMASPLADARLVILDRDGVINQDSSEFVKSADEWIPLDGSIEAIALLSKAGFSVAVASNQSGLARGLFGVDALAKMHEKMLSLVAGAGGRIDHVGDSLRDLQAARSVLARPILVRTGNGKSTEDNLPADLSMLEVYDDLGAAVAALLAE
jgi:D-glycero-D-manno-heptose 1,7-bisphosphate phosphatase